MLLTTLYVVRNYGINHRILKKRCESCNHLCSWEFKKKKPSGHIYDYPLYRGIHTTESLAKEGRQKTQAF